MLQVVGSYYVIYVTKFYKKIIASRQKNVPKK